MSENAKTVVVDIRAGDRIDRQAYAADDWKSDEHDGLTVTRDGRHVAEFAPGQWLSVRDGGAWAPDVTARALGIARKALRDILGELCDDPGSPDEVLSKIESLANEALDAIFAETE